MRTQHSGVLRASALLLLCALFLAGCGNSGAPADASAAPADGPDPAGDAAAVLESGVLTVGVTDYAPLDYLENGEWTGFDAELAVMFARWIGAKVSFVPIDWEQKTALLRSGAIDCIWNGMTKTAELERVIDCSAPYLVNTQVIVLPREQFSRYDTAEKSYHLLFAVESGSIAPATAAELKLRTIAYSSQPEAMEAVANKRCDAAIVDLLFAEEATAEGAEFEALQFGFPFSREELCVGLRKGSSLTQKINDFLAFSAKNGSLRSLAGRYGLTGALASAGANETER